MVAIAANIRVKKAALIVSRENATIVYLGGILEHRVVSSNPEVKRLWMQYASRQIVCFLLTEGALVMRVDIC